jgi:ribosomal protein L11 methylase PrmA
MEKYADALHHGGYILFSGFFAEDLSAILEKAALFNLTLSRQEIKNNWIVGIFQKLYLPSA